MQATVLDVGCGSGRDAKYFIGSGIEVTALEPSSAMEIIAKSVRWRMPSFFRRYLMVRYHALGV